MKSNTWIKLVSGLKISVLILLLSASSVFAALDATIEWEVRTTGNDDNGGGYDTVNNGGTDYSLQNAAQLTLTDLACLDTTTTLTSATGGFTVAMVDNLIQIKSGTNFTVGFYEITACTDTNTVTIDRTAADAGTNASAGTGSVGGGLLTITKAMDNLVGGNDVFIKSGTYTETVTVPAFTNVNGNPVWIAGYTATHWDIPTGTDRPLIDAAATRANCIITGTETYFLAHLRCANATAIGIYRTGTTNTEISLLNVKSSNNTGDGIETASPYSCVGCEFNNNAIGADSGIYAKFYAYCYFHDNSSSGVVQLDRETVYEFCISDTNAAVGFQQSRCGKFSNCIAYNNGTGFEWSLSAAGDTAYGWLINNIAQANTTGYYKLSSAYRHILFINNIAYDNTTNIHANVKEFQIGTITTNPNFNDPAAGDFTITTGSSAIDAGFTIDDYTAVVGAYKMNCGVDQDDNTAAGGAAGGQGASWFIQ